NRLVKSGRLDLAFLALDPLPAAALRGSEVEVRSGFPQRPPRLQCPWNPEERSRTWTFPRPAAPAHNVAAATTNSEVGGRSSRTAAQKPSKPSTVAKPAPRSGASGSRRKCVPKGSPATAMPRLDRKGRSAHDWYYWNHERKPHRYRLGCDTRREMAYQPLR